MEILFQVLQCSKIFLQFQVGNILPSSFISLYFPTDKTIMVLLQTLSYRTQFIRSILTRVNNLIIQPSNHPTIQPSNHPTIQSSNHPTIQPSNHPTIQPSNHYTSNHPIIQLFNHPTVQSATNPIL